MTGRKYYTDTAKIPFAFFILSMCLAIAIFTLMTVCNMNVSYHFIKNFPKLISALAHSYQADPHLFNSNFYLMHIYFGLLLYVGLPIMTGTSLILSILYLKQKKSNRILSMLFMPLAFVITTYALAELCLAFT